MRWLKSLNQQARFNEPLKKHTSFKIGGPAKAWVRPRDREELKNLILQCRRRKIPYFIIGAGSNLLVSDQGFKGVVINLSSPLFSSVAIEGNYVSAGAGVMLPRLINRLKTQGLSGLEFLAGIPATLGGSVIMNAGGKQKNIAGLVEAVMVMDKRGRIKRLNKSSLRFGYRWSSLNRYIIIEVFLRLVRKSPDKIKQDISRLMAKKRATQPLSAKSAGCIFKNPRPDLTAGQLIQACGLKGRAIGGAEVSRKHANYIINRDNARARDIMRLMRLIQKQAHQQFRVRLRPEIKIIG